jgi:hypothetical protein
MAVVLYKDGSDFQQSADAAFDNVYHPGNTTEYSGLYKCIGCKHIIVHTADKALPPQNHHQHSTSQGAIRWKLIAGHSGN